MPKVAKRSNSGKNPEAVPVPKQSYTCIAQQNATYTGTGQRCIGTTQQNATYTGTGQSCTGTAVPKMSRIVYFCIIKLKFTHRSHRNLTKYLREVQIRLELDEKRSVPRHLGDIR